MPDLMANSVPDFALLILRFGELPFGLKLSLNVATVACELL